MSRYAIVVFPKGELKDIQSFRSNYDPKAGLIAPHITLVFPFQLSGDEQVVLDEIAVTLKKFKPFSLVLKGTHLDPDDNLLHLLVADGAEKIVALHDALYSGILASFLRKDLVYTPHMTIGAFEDPLQAQESFKVAAQLETSLQCYAVSVIKIEEPHAPRTTVAEFLL